MTPEMKLDGDVWTIPMHSREPSSMALIVFMIIACMVMAVCLTAQIWEISSGSPYVLGAIFLVVGFVFIRSRICNVSHTELLLNQKLLRQYRPRHPTQKFVDMDLNQFTVVMSRPMSANSIEVGVYLTGGAKTVLLSQFTQEIKMSLSIPDPEGAKVLRAQLADKLKMRDLGLIWG